MGSVLPRPCWSCTECASELSIRDGEEGVFPYQSLFPVDQGLLQVCTSPSLAQNLSGRRSLGQKAQEGQHSRGGSCCQRLYSCHSTLPQPSGQSGGPWDCMWHLMHSPYFSIHIDDIRYLFHVYVSKISIISTGLWRKLNERCVKVLRKIYIM